MKWEMLSSGTLQHPNPGPPSGESRLQHPRADSSRDTPLQPDHHRRPVWLEEPLSLWLRGCNTTSSLPIVAAKRWTSPAKQGGEQGTDSVVGEGG